MADNAPEVSDVTLEGARKQKIHNLKLKTACLENEEFVTDLHVSDWSETQKQKLQAAHEKGSELLASVETGTKWNLTAAYDIQKLMRVCGLEMSVRELYKPDDKPQFMEVVGLKKTLNELKQHRNKTRIVSFTLHPGNRVGLIGPNGAGKTTLINLITGVLAPSQGSVWLMGEDVSHLPQPQRVQRGLARTFQITQLAPHLPIHRQVELAIHQREGSVNRMFRALEGFQAVRDEAAQILRTLRMDALARRCPVELAYGEQRLVEMALAMALKPRVLLLDEPMAGVPSGERQVVLDALDTLPSDLAILMIEHDMDLVFNFADRMLVLAEGALLAEGTPQDIRRHPAVRIAYLGAEA